MTYYKWSIIKLFHQRVKNATNSVADESMIQYRKDHISKFATVDLSKKTY